MKRWQLACSACMFLALAGDAGAQTSAPPRLRTTKSGIYTREQASRGEDVYFGMCKNCHTPESHTGTAFTTKWNGKALSELFVYIRDQMPKNEPGTLTPEENADVLAYLLKLNRMPEGPADLPADANAMKAIRIETTKPVRKEK